MPIKLLMADDHRLVRQALRRYMDVTPDIEVVAEASTGDEVLQILREGGPAPDVVLMDIRMSGMDGLEAAAAIRDLYPDIRVVMLTALDDRRLVVEAVRAGVRGYVLKARDANELLQTIRLVAQGALVIDPELAPALTAELSGPRDRDIHPLTARETEILQLLAYGHTNRTVAEALYIAPDTVKTHIEHVFDKLGTRDRTAAVAEALRRGLIE